MSDESSFLSIAGLSALTEQIGFVENGVSQQKWDLTGFTRAEVLDDLGAVIGTVDNAAPGRCDSAGIDIAQDFWATVTATPEKSAAKQLTMEVSFRYQPYSDGFDLYAGEGSGAELTEVISTSIGTPFVTVAHDVISRSFSAHTSTPLWAQAFWEQRIPPGILAQATSAIQTPALTVAELTPASVTPPPSDAPPPTETPTAPPISAPSPGIVAGQPTIAGIPEVGSRLRVTTSTWHPIPVALSYQWMRNGKPIAHATGREYRLTAHDAGARISVRVTGTHGDAAPVTRATSSVLVKKVFTTTPKPVLHGRFRIGSTVSVTLGTWRPASATHTLQWLRNGKPIAGAHSRSYHLTRADAGARIAVTVTMRKADYVTTSRTSVARLVR